MKLDSALESYVWSSQERLGGTPCFRNTRVPVDALFANLAAGMTLDEFLSEFEGVTREQAVAVLNFARQIFEPDSVAA